MIAAVVRMVSPALAALYHHGPRCRADAHTEKGDVLKENRLPVNADEIHAAWLEELLRPRFAGVRVADVEVLERHEVTNSHARLSVTFHEPDGAPDTMFCKLAPHDPARRQSILASGMGLREARFYATLAPGLSMRIPDAYVALYNEDDGTFLLLLEDLTQTGCTVSDGPTSVSVDAVAQVLDELAELHVRYESPASRASLTWIPRPQARPSDYGRTMLRFGLDNHRDRLSDRFASIAECYIAHGEVLQDLWTRGDPTVIHGDTHIGNLFDDHGRVGFLDWGIINLNTPLRDVSYFMNMSMDINDRRARQEELLRHYLAARVALGGAPISFDDAWTAHRLHAAYCVPASCQVVTFPDTATARRRVFAAAFLARAEAAIEDLEAIAALRTQGVSL